MQTHKLGDIFKIISGGTPSTSIPEYWDGNIPWVTSANIHGIRDIRIERYVTQEGVENSSTKLVPENSILVATRVGLGKVAIAPFDICFSQDIQALMPNNDMNTDFVLHFLEYSAISFKYKGRGTTISGITKKQLSDLNIPIYSPEEQREIIEKIERISSKVTAARESLGKVVGHVDISSTDNMMSSLKISILKRYFGEISI